MLQFLSKIFSSFFIGILLVLVLHIQTFSQATKVSITIINEEDAYYIGVPIYVKANAVDSAGTTDQNYNGNVKLEAVGPDTLLGTSTVAFSKGKASIQLAYVNTTGTYQIRCSSAGLITSAIKTITVVNNPYTNGGASATTLKCWDEMYDTVYTDSFFSKYIFALNANGEIDTTFSSGYAAVQQISGTTISNITNKKAYFNKGIGIAEQINISTTGTYQLVYTYNSLTSDTFTIIAIDYPYDSSNCVIPDSIQTPNLGIYGAVGLDFTFSTINNRLFIAVETPQSLFFSDDTGKTWIPSFPYDSLEYDCGHRGWGGRAMRVLTNSKGWVAVYTNQNQGSLNASVINFHNGDTGHWNTALDDEIADNWQYENAYGVKNIGLTDYYLYSLLGNYVIMQDTDIYFPKKVISLKKWISATNNRPEALWISASNTASGFPFYVIADTLGNTPQTQGNLYRCDNTNTVVKITLPLGLSGIEKVFIPPVNTSADTVFISGIDDNDSSQIYVSFNGGLNWINIGGHLNFELTDVDYSSTWATNISGNNGILLLANGTYSKDLGTTWENINASALEVKAILPSNPDYIIRLMGGCIYYNTSGLNGNVIKSKSEGLAASKIIQIAKTNDKSVFYLATQSGLAYTTAYTDTSIKYIDKWHAPYGQFPVSSVDTTNIYTAVAIDPLNSQHVVCGNLGALYVSMSGPNGFATINPFGYPNAVPLTDIVFVNANIVLALKGDNTDYAGSLWRSTDGGYNWSNVLSIPEGGNEIAVAYGTVDTSVFMGSGLADGAGSLWKSTNLGQTWVKVADGPKCPNDNTVTNMPITALAAKPNHSGNLYVGASSNTCNAFMYTDDGGISFQNIPLLNDSDHITSIALNNNYSDSIYVAVGREIFVYDAFKDTLTRVYRGLPGEIINDLASGSILVGTTTGFYGIHLDDNNGNIVNLKNIQKHNSFVNIYPNPSSNDIFLDVSLVTHSSLQIYLIDFMGKEIRAIANEEHVTGVRHYSMNISNLASGTYFVKVKTNDESITKKVVVIK